MTDRRPRFLLLGAGAVGGYLGGRLLEAGAKVTFLVRPTRREQLARDGLVVKSPSGDMALAVNTVAHEELRPGWDFIILTNKAYDLDDAILTVRPAVDRASTIVPLLNGLAHVERLKAAFGDDRVTGGTVYISSTLGTNGVIHHLNDFARIIHGEFDGRLTDRTHLLQAALERCRGIEARQSQNIMSELWTKFAQLGALAASSLLFRGSTGEIASVQGGSTLMEQLLHVCVQVAAFHGYPLAPDVIAARRRLLADTGPKLVSSLLRDLEGGGRVENDHILGYLLSSAKQAAIPNLALLEAAWVQAEVYQRRRASA